MNTKFVGDYENLATDNQYYEQMNFSGEQSCRKWCIIFKIFLIGCPKPTEKDDGLYSIPDVQNHSSQVK